jgi:hypothetical protein
VAEEGQKLPKDKDWWRDEDLGKVDESTEGFPLPPKCVLEHLVTNSILLQVHCCSSTKYYMLQSACSALDVGSSLQVLANARSHGSLKLFHIDHFVCSNYVAHRTSQARAAQMAM